MAGVVKLELIHRAVVYIYIYIYIYTYIYIYIYKGGGDLRMYDHGFIYMDICYLYVANSN